MAKDSQRSRLLDTLPAGEVDAAADVLAGSSTIALRAGEPYFHASFERAALLVVERGFVVLRGSSPGQARPVITCEAGPGRVILPPSSGEVLCALVDSEITAISVDERDRLLALPGTARALLDHLSSTLAEKQDALGNFGSTRHVDRVRRKLLQLARSYGRVARGGIRIDFPVTHSLLAEMIGSSRETVTRAVDELQRAGFMARRGHTYRLLVPPDCVAAEAPS